MRFFPFLIIFLVSFFFTQPYFRPGFFLTDDGEWAIVRLAEMQREIIDGQIPPRWSDYLNHGFGYPLFSFVYPFPYYLGIFFRLFKFGYTITIKILFFLSVFLSGIFMYFLAKKITEERVGSLTTSIFYLVAPFRLINLYVRGSLGESLCFIFFPLLFYSTFEYISHPNPLFLALTSLFLAFLILTHNITALFFFPIYFLFFLFMRRFLKTKISFWRLFLPVFFLGFSSAAYFFLPALLEKKYLLLSKIKLAEISKNFVSLPELFFSFQPSEKRLLFTVGGTHFLAVILSFLGFIFLEKKLQKKFLSLFFFSLVSLFILVFFLTPFSAFFWRYPPFSWIDFPWRLLTPLTFLFSFSTVFLSLNKVTRILGLVFLLPTIFFNYNFAQAKEYFVKPDELYLTNDATTTSLDELIPLWVKEKPRVRYQEKVEIENGSGKIEKLKYNSHLIDFRLSLSNPAILKINTIYFPGWKFTFNGGVISPDFSKKDGLMRFSLPAGQFHVRGEFQETPIRLFSDILSFFGGATIFLLLFRSLFLKKNKRLRKNL